MTPLALRAAVPEDTPQIRRLALDNGMFESDEMGLFDEMLEGFFSGTLENHHWLVAEIERSGGTVAAAAYFAPEPFADRMWNLYFIATAPAQQSSGAGTQLIEAVEGRLREMGSSLARTLVVDTSSLAEYEQARSFYTARGFVEEARIREFYGPGDDKVTFWKQIAP
ncbi:MAG: GNAT family N-acetyltransferase [Acidobacteriota bacterium]